MFDIGWTEVLILVVVGLFVIGPKEIPRVLGFVGKLVAKFRSITRELQESVDEAIHQTELEDIKKEITSVNNEITKDINHTFAFANNLDINKSENVKKSESNTKKRSKQKNKNSTKDLSKDVSEEKRKNALSKTTKYEKEVLLPAGLKHVKTNNFNKSKEIEVDKNQQSKK